MKIIIAPDSFKESLSAPEAARAIESGVKTALPDANTLLLPIADGGEGTVEALVGAQGGRYVETRVRGPLGEPVIARWGVLPDNTGVIEMAAASGLPLVARGRRNPLLTNTFGTGQLIRAALDEGCSRIILGLGGSATCDGGAGALVALGARLLDRGGAVVPCCPKGLLDLHAIDLNNIDPRLAKTQIVVASDVDNPLLGSSGAAAVFGPQKGADEAAVLILERALTRLSVAAASLGKDIDSLPGGGAAGGLAAGLSLAAPLTMQHGIELVLETVGFEDFLVDAGLVFSGEGKIDGQSVMGKALTGIAALTKKNGVPLIALCGAVGSGYERLLPLGVTAILPIAPGPLDLEQSLARAKDLLAAAAAGAMRIFLAGAGL